MSKLRFRYETIEFGDVDFHQRTLRDTQEFSDDDGVADALGVTEAIWPLFGVLWPSGRALAELMWDYAIDGRRVLEVGCGIGLASQVLNHRNVDITATDHHPDAGTFLQVNTEFNDQDDIPFVRAGWMDEETDLGRFDLIIGADILYETGQPQLLSGFIERHAKPSCEVLIVETNRGLRSPFNKIMATLGFVYTKTDAEPGRNPNKPYTGQILSYLR